MKFVPTTPGQIPLSDISAWIFEGSTSMTTMDVDFNAAIAPGPQVFLVARWFNRRSRSRPLCHPVSTNVQGGMVMAA